MVTTLGHFTVPNLLKKGTTEIMVQAKMAELKKVCFEKLLRHFVIQLLPYDKVKEKLQNII